jgi:hypothetical protein
LAGYGLDTHDVQCLYVLSQFWLRALFWTYPLSSLLKSLGFGSWFCFCHQVHILLHVKLVVLNCGGDDNEEEEEEEGGEGDDDDDDDDDDELSPK